MQQIISLAPTPEGRIERILPTFFAAGRSALAFVTQNWVVGVLVLATAGSVAAAITFAAISILERMPR